MIRNLRSIRVPLTLLALPVLSTTFTSCTQTSSFGALGDIDLLHVKFPVVPTGCLGVQLQPDLKVPNPLGFNNLDSQTLNVVLPESSGSCPWTIQRIDESSDWLNLAPASPSGSANSTFTYSAEALNSRSLVQTTTLKIDAPGLETLSIWDQQGIQFHVNMDDCGVSGTSSNLNFDASGRLISDPTAAKAQPLELVGTNCNWQASVHYLSEQSWMNLGKSTFVDNRTTIPIGNGRELPTVAVANNDGPIGRNAILVLKSNFRTQLQLPIHQDAPANSSCRVLSAAAGPSVYYLGDSGGNVSVELAGADCQWSVDASSEESNWIHPVPLSSSANGNQNIRFSLDLNQTSERLGNITIQSKSSPDQSLSIPVKQFFSPPCNLVLRNPHPQPAYDRTAQTPEDVTVAAQTGKGCNWIAQSPDASDWIQMGAVALNPGTSIYNQLVNFKLLQNSTGALRTGHIEISNSEAGAGSVSQVITIDQSPDSNVTPTDLPVDCQVSNFSDSGPCSATQCGTQGTKPQTRTVIRQPENGGDACPTLSQRVACSGPACQPVDCEVSNFVDSGACSATQCGTLGTKLQTRTVTRQPANGGTACPALTQRVSCSAPSCAAVDCQVSGFVNSGSCNATQCGTQGTRLQTRTVTRQPANGGAACPALTQTVACSAPACTPVDCRVSDFVNSGSCSATQCGTQGTRLQTRTILTQPANGGAACPGLTQTVTCNAPACPPTVSVTGDGNERVNGVTTTSSARILATTANGDGTFSIALSVTASAPFNAFPPSPLLGGSCRTGSWTTGWNSSTGAGTYTVSDTGRTCSIAFSANRPGVPCHDFIAVGGHANPYLAGQPAGTTIRYTVRQGNPIDTAGDSSNPRETPPFLDSRSSCLTPGLLITFKTSGGVSNGVNTPGGGRPHQLGAYFGISNMTALLNTLVGVFSTETPQSRTNAPAPGGLDFSSASSMNYLTLSPQLNQLFYIGDGKTSSGVSQTVMVPPGTQRIYFGAWDGDQWNNNSGTISITIAPPGN